MTPFRTEIWREGDCQGRIGPDAHPPHEAAGRNANLFNERCLMKFCCAICQEISSFVLLKTSIKDTWNIFVIRFIIG